MQNEEIEQNSRDFESGKDESSGEESSKKRGRLIQNGVSELSKQ